MAGWTNRGKMTALDHLFDALALPTNYKLHLVSTTPDDNTNVLGDLTESSNYTALTLDGTDFDQPTEDDVNNWGQCQLDDQVFTAAGGDCTATYCVLCDDNGTPANRVVYCFWSLGGSRTISNGQTMTLQDLTIRLTET